MASLRITSLLCVGFLLTTELFAQGPRYRSIADGCAGTLGTPLLEADGSSLPIFGDTFRARLSNVPDGPAVGIIGLNTITWGGFGLPLDLGIIGMPGCSLFTDIRYSKGLFINNGEADWDIALPNLPVWVGRSFYQQVLVLDPAANPGGAVMSNANLGIIGVEKASPLVKIVFPPAKSLTDETTIMVRGTAVDPDGVAEVRVNGLLANTSDGFLNWQVRVPLTTVISNLVVSARDSLGNLDPNAAVAEVKAWPLVDVPRVVALDESGLSLLTFRVSPLAMISYNPITGEHRVVSSETVGVGPMVYGADAILHDQGRALVLNSQGIYEVDMATGDRQVLADELKGWGVSAPRDMAIHGTRALVVNGADHEIVSVDLISGAGGVISGPNRGSGPLLHSPLSIVVHGDEAFVVDQLHRAIIAIDIGTGDRRFLSGEANGQFYGVGPLIGRPMSLVKDGDRILMVDRLPPAVLSVDLTTGDRGAVSGRIFTPPLVLTTIGEGPVFEVPLDIDVRGNLAVVGDTLDERKTGAPPSLYAIDLDTGRRTELAPPGIADGPVLSRAEGITMLGDEVLVLDESSPTKLLAVNPLTGERRLISGDGIGTGPELVEPLSIAMGGQKAYVVCGESESSILSVDLGSGDRSLITGSGRGTGPVIGFSGMALLGDRAVVVGREVVGVHMVDLITGDRWLISNMITATNQYFRSTLGVAADDSHAFFSASILGQPIPSPYSLLSVDLETGVSTVLSGLGVGSGPDMFFRSHIILQGRTAILGTGNFIIDLDTGVRSATFWPEYLGPRVGSAFVPRGDLSISASGSNGVTVFDLVTGESVILSRRTSPN